MKIVNKNIEVRIYPTKMDKNDNGEKIVSIDKIESNIGISRFIFNKELKFINYFKKLLKKYGYNDKIKIKINDKSCSIILAMLRQEYSFLEKAESSSRQQSQRDLIKAFERYHNPHIKSSYPTLKTKKKTRKFTFRIINNNNNVRITKDKNGYDKIKLAKLGLIKFKTSKKYKNLLKKGSDQNDETVKIKHVTIKNVHGIYYAVFNIEYIHIPKKITGPRMQLGIDIGCSKLAVMSNGQEIPNLCLTKETENIIRHQKNMTHHKKNSTRYHKAQKLFHKSWKKLLNKRNDYYNKITDYIVKNSSMVAVQNENIISWKNNKHLSHKIQLNAPRELLNKIEKKCKQEDVDFVKVPKGFASTQICSKCHKKNENIKGLKNLGIRNWDCPECGAHHDRDCNAAINILHKGLQIVGTTMQ